MKNFKAASGREKLNILLPVLFMAAGLFARLWLFGEHPGDINQDEAFAGYEAYSLLKTGKDCAGYVFPVYLTAWGSGMNALESWLMLPFIALFGLKTWVIRLPQLLVGLLSLWVIYLCVNKLFGKTQALLALMLLSLCPWHIMLCRWGLESNLAPGFLLFGFWFFLKGMDDSRFFLLSALMYGLSLYSYATIWPFLPLLLLLSLAYGMRRGKIRPDSWLLASGLLLFLLALPLLLFLAVNFGFIEEIRLPFMSIPELQEMRAGEISLKYIPENLINMLKILFFQSDGLPWNSASAFGLLYPPAIVFCPLGLVFCLREALRARREKKFSPCVLLLIQLSAGLLAGALIHVNVNRINIIFIPLVILCALGIYSFSALFRKNALKYCIILYMGLFLLFQLYYFGPYRESIEPAFRKGLQQTVEAADERDCRVYVSTDVYYPQLLFYTAMDPDEFRAEVCYRNRPSAYLQVRSIGKWIFTDEFDMAQAGDCCILSPWDEADELESRGFAAQQYGYFKLAFIP